MMSPLISMFNFIKLKFMITGASYLANILAQHINVTTKNPSNVAARKVDLFFCSVICIYSINYVSQTTDIILNHIDFLL